MPAYPCMPPCIGCRTAGVCDGANAPQGGRNTLARSHDGYLGPGEDSGRVGRKEWRPNAEPDTLLECGCWIPWPIITLIGSAKQNKGRQVQCDRHGWQHVAQKEINRATKALRKFSQSSGQTSFEDIPPY